MNNTEYLSKKHPIIYMFIWILFFLWLVFSYIILKIFNFSNNIFIFLTLFWQAFIVIIYYIFCVYEANYINTVWNEIIWVKKIWFLKYELVKCNLSDIKEIKIISKWFFANFFKYYKVEIITENKIISMNYSLNSNELIEKVKKK